MSNDDDEVLPAPVLSETDQLKALVSALQSEVAALRAKLALDNESDAPLLSLLSNGTPFAVSKLNVEQFVRAQPSVRDARGKALRTEQTWLLHYYDLFVVDAWPLLELETATPSDVAGLRVPSYDRKLTVPLPLPANLSDSELRALFVGGGAGAAAATAAASSSAVVGGVAGDDRSRNACWNCNSTAHAVSACPHPRNERMILANRTHFRAQKDARDTAKERYYDRGSKSDAFSPFSPGVLSPALRAALGVGDADVPDFVLRMRAFGGFGPTYQALVGTDNEVQMVGLNVNPPPQQQQPPPPPYRAVPATATPYNPFAATSDDVPQSRNVRSDYVRTPMPARQDYVRPSNPDELAKRARLTLPSQNYS
jgi:hypothetical protein